jgi:hypothetical protein
VCGAGAAKPRRGPPTRRSVPAITSRWKSIGGVRTTAIVVPGSGSLSHVRLRATRVSKCRRHCAYGASRCQVSGRVCPTAASRQERRSLMTQSLFGHALSTVALATPGPYALRRREPVVITARMTRIAPSGSVGLMSQRPAAHAAAPPLDAVCWPSFSTPSPLEPAGLVADEPCRMVSAGQPAAYASRCFVGHVFNRDGLGFGPPTLRPATERDWLHGRLQWATKRSSASTVLSNSESGLDDKPILWVSISFRWRTSSSVVAACRRRWQSSGAYISYSS